MRRVEIGNRPAKERILREAYAKQFSVVIICLFFLFARSPDHLVDEIHVHGGFLAEPALVSKRYSA